MLKLQLITSAKQCQPRLVSTVTILLIRNREIKNQFTHGMYIFMARWNCLGQFRGPWG